MSVNWECSKCEAYTEAKATIPEGEKDSPEWTEFCDLREALIWALLCTGFPPKSDWAITAKNWEQMFARLKTVEKISGSYRIYHPAKDGDAPRTEWFTPAEVYSMIGLSVNAGNKTDAEFYKWVKATLEDQAKLTLSNYHRKLEKDEQAA